MIQFNFSLTHWVSAEILSANSLKVYINFVNYLIPLKIVSFYRVKCQLLVNF